MLVVDLVVARHAVGDAQQPHRPPGRRPEAAVAGVGAEDHGAVRGMKARVLVAGPDYLVRDQPNVGHRVVGVHRVGHDLLAPVLKAHIVPDPAVVAVGVVDVADVLLFPNPVGDPHDVVDDVPVARFEAAHRLGLDVLRVPVQEPVRSAPPEGFERDPKVSGHVLVAERIESEVRAPVVPGRVRILDRTSAGRGFEWTAVGGGHGRSPSSLTWLAIFSRAGPERKRPGARAPGRALRAVGVRRRRVRPPPAPGRRRGAPHRSGAPRSRTGSRAGSCQ